MISWTDDKLEMISKILVQLNQPNVNDNLENIKDYLNDMIKVLYKYQANYKDSILQQEFDRNINELVEFCSNPKNLLKPTTFFLFNSELNQKQLAIKQQFLYLRNTTNYMFYVHRDTISNVAVPNNNSKISRNQLNTKSVNLSFAIENINFQTQAKFVQIPTNKKLYIFDITASYLEDKIEKNLNLNEEQLVRLYFIQEQEYLKKIYFWMIDQQIGLKIPLQQRICLYNNMVIKVSKEIKIVIKELDPLLPEYANIIHQNFKRYYPYNFLYTKSDYGKRIIKNSPQEYQSFVSLKIDFKEEYLKDSCQYYNFSQINLDLPNLNSKYTIHYDKEIGFSLERQQLFEDGFQPCIMLQEVYQIVMNNGYMAEFIINNQQSLSIALEI